MGVCCCVSYRITESWVATAYIIRYGSVNAGLGPDGAPEVSRVSDFGPETEASAEAGGGGGSMTEGAGEAFERGSGRGGIGSSDEEVSMVMYFVEGGELRRV